MSDKTAIIIGVVGAAIAAYGVYQYSQGKDLLGNDQSGSAATGTGGTPPTGGPTPTNPASAPATTPGNFSFLNAQSTPVLSLFTALNNNSQVLVGPVSAQGAIATAINSGSIKSGGYVFQDASGAIVGGYNADQGVSLNANAALVLAQQGAAGTNPNLATTGYSAGSFATVAPTPNTSTSGGTSVYVPPGANVPNAPLASMLPSNSKGATQYSSVPASFAQSPVASYQPPASAAPAKVSAPINNVTLHPNIRLNK